MIPAPMITMPDIFASIIDSRAEESQRVMVGINISLMDTWSAMAAMRHDDRMIIRSGIVLNEC